jgi:hypothetical protein
VALIEGREADGELVVALGGPPAQWVLTGAPGGPPYWLRVWGTRGLLYSWSDAALPALRSALRDDAWRVREMAAKVVARHRLDPVRSVVSALQDDGVLRVRAAATRALDRLTEPPAPDDQSGSAR